MSINNIAGRNCKITNKSHAKTVKEKSKQESVTNELAQKNALLKDIMQAANLGSDISQAHLIKNFISKALSEKPLLSTQLDELEKQYIQLNPPNLYHPVNIQKNILNKKPILDINQIPQTGEIILNKNEKLIDNLALEKINYKKYKSDFYSPWLQTAIKFTKNVILEAFEIKKIRYAENFSIYSKSWFNQLLDNSNITQLGKLNTRAIIVENTSLRNIPTMKPAYYDPYEAGEGYPFDTIQENLLRIGEPILISHFTKDLEFVFVETNAKRCGFVQAKHIALINNEAAENLLHYDIAIVIKDNVKLYNNNIFVNTLDLGTVLPFVSKNSNLIELCLPLRDKNGLLTLSFFEINFEDVITKPLSFEPKNVAMVIDKLIDNPYGWGGYLQHRDCAQILKDYFALFGIHMPIYSSDQINMGKYISLEGMEDDEKILKIKKMAKPFSTILYKKGHVVLYLGEYKDQLVIFHSIWGIRLYDAQDVEYRYIIGKSAITTIKFGKELEGYDHDKSSFVRTLTGMAIIE